MGEDLDLFGIPVRPRKGMKGRPPFEVTAKDRNKVKLLLALGWVPGRIANAIEVSLSTLKRHFRAELAARDAMRDRLDARRIEVAAEKAFEGNPSAMRLFEAMIEKSDRMGMVNQISGRRSDVPPTPLVERRGKKVTKQGDAAAAIAADPDLFGKPPTLN